MADNSAHEILALALDAYQSPISYQDWWTSTTALPEGCGVLLRIAGGDLEWTDHYCRATGINQRDLQQAATFFIKQTFFAQGANYYRILGLNPGATAEQIKEHYRLLMRLFHPDRLHTQGAWTDVYAGRVNQAYNTLRKTESRDDYDATLSLCPDELRAAKGDAIFKHSYSSFQSSRPRVPGSAGTRHLPYLVFTGVVLLAVFFLIDIYFSNGYRVVLVEDHDPAIPPRPIVDMPQADAFPSKAVDMPVSTATPDSRVGVAVNRNVTGDTSYPGAKAHSREEPSTALSSNAQTEPRTSIASPASIIVTAPPPAAAIVSRPPPPTIPIASERRDLKRPITETVKKPVIKDNNHKDNNPSSHDRKAAADPNKSSASETPARSSSGHGLVTKPRENTQIKPAVSASPPDVSTRELQLLLGRFIAAYERGDLTGLMALFANQASAGGKRGKANIRREYENLFNNTGSRRISFNNMAWRRAGNIIRGDGQFIITTYVLDEKRPNRYSGKISFEVEQQGGRLLIRGFYHNLDS